MEAVKRHKTKRPPQKAVKKTASAPGSSNDAAPPPPVPLPPPPDDHQDARRRKGPAKSWQPGIGARIAYDEYQHRDGKLYCNYTIECSRHASCFKTRGRTPQNLRQHGEKGVLAFLHSWLNLPEDFMKSHAQDNPSSTDVFSYLATHDAEIGVLFHQLTGSPE